MHRTSFKTPSFNISFSLTLHIPPLLLFHHTPYIYIYIPPLQQHFRVEKERFVQDTLQERAELSARVDALGLHLSMAQRSLREAEENHLDELVKTREEADDQHRNYHEMIVEKMTEQIRARDTEIERLRALVKERERDLPEEAQRTIDQLKLKNRAMVMDDRRLKLLLREQFSNLIKSLSTTVGAEIISAILKAEEGSTKKGSRGGVTGGRQDNTEVFHIPSVPRAPTSPRPTSDEVESSLLSPRDLPLSPSALGARNARLGNIIRRMHELSSEKWDNLGSYDSNDMATLKINILERAESYEARVVSQASTSQEHTGSNKKPSKQTAQDHIVQKANQAELEANGTSRHRAPLSSDPIEGTDAMTMVGEVFHRIQAILQRCLRTYDNWKPEIQVNSNPAPSPTSASSKAPSASRLQAKQRLEASRKALHEKRAAQKKSSSSYIQFKHGDLQVPSHLFVIDNEAKTEGEQGGSSQPSP